MTPEVHKTLEITCWALGGLAGLIAVWFKVLDSYHGTSEKKAVVKERYAKRWKALRDGGWFELPERGVKWLLVIKSSTRLGAYLSSIFKLIRQLVNTSNHSQLLRLILPTLVTVVLLFPSPISIMLLYGWGIGLVAWLPVLAVLIYTVLEKNTHYDGIKKAEILVLGGMGLCGLIGVFTILEFSLAMPLVWIMVAMILSFPSFMFTIYLGGLAIYYFQSLIHPSRNSSGRERGTGIGFALSFSFFITAFALLIGTLASPSSHLPQTMQMFLVNVVCDGVTLMLTFAILGRAISDVKNKLFPIPVAILLDIAVAALLACLSLYLGLIGTPNALTLVETMNVLFARSPDGLAIELGPYFWAMHTTFIPTLIYLLVIILAYVGKLFIIPFAKVLRISSENDKPHMYSAMLFTFVAAFFGILVGALKYFPPEQVVGG